MRIEYVETTQDNLSNVPIQAGQVVLTSDTHRQYLDFTGERKNLAFKSEVDVNTSAIEAIVNVNAGCNLLPCSATSQTIEGVTWTVYSDGTVTASGTSNGNGSILVYHRFTSECVLNSKEVVLKGCPAGGDASSYAIEGFRVAGSSSYLDNREEYGEGVRFTWNNDSSQVVPEIQLAISPNYAIQGTITFKPMLYDARLKPTGYVQYSMTNAELTDKVDKLTGDVIQERFSVMADGVKSYAQLLYELFTTSSWTDIVIHKLTAKIIIETSVLPFSTHNSSDSKIYFGNSYISAGNTYTTAVVLDATVSNCQYAYGYGSNITNLSSAVPSAGGWIHLCY